MVIHIYCAISFIMMKIFLIHSNYKAKKTHFKKVGFSLLKLKLQQIRSDDQIGLSLQI